MSPPRLHADEVDLDDRIMRHLVDTRFPHWADRPLRRLDTTGTDIESGVDAVLDLLAQRGLL